MQNEDYEHFDEPRSPEDIDLTQFDDDLAEAPGEEREFETIPDSKYQVLVDKVEMARSKERNLPILKGTL